MLSEGTDLTLIPRAITDSPLPRPLPIIRGDETRTLRPADLYAIIRDHTGF